MEASTILIVSVGVDVSSVIVDVSGSWGSRCFFVAWSCARSAPWAAQSTVGEAQVCEVGNLDEFFCDEVKTIGSDANGGEIEVSEDRRSG